MKAKLLIPGSAHLPGFFPRRVPNQWVANASLAKALQFSFWKNDAVHFRVGDTVYLMSRTVMARKQAPTILTVKRRSIGKGAELSAVH